MQSSSDNKLEAISKDVEMHTSPDVEEGEEIKRDRASMIAIAGMIGTGLFLSSGQVIAIAGPAGALIAYIIMGLIAAGVSYTTGEITAFMPVTGGFIRHATKFVELALGAATGWNFWYTRAISAPAEITATSTVVQFWNVPVNVATEVVFATLKIMLILGLILGGLVIDLGGGPDQQRLGFHYWNTPGAFNE
ncbi:uncharacterized protein N7477_002128 [Penicillium maclennaniae]|uniref:uncharacterized protein n=1 Tax=Penicillium maclennaniae TaxID=1343394 RepID=UPI002541AB8B|nr:uncharacterized protein N7477_002128 [Penicillium maclennaniae]KAJ5676495.1 hypothetical protein N7477_002128 [Penicillium maclennaniae]